MYARAGGAVAVGTDSGQQRVLADLDAHAPVAAPAVAELHADGVALSPTPLVGAVSVAQTCEISPVSPREEAAIAPTPATGTSATSDHQHDRRSAGACAAVDG